MAADDTGIPAFFAQFNGVMIFFSKRDGTWIGAAAAA
jgi:hypothetical protein